MRLRVGGLWQIFYRLLAGCGVRAVSTAAGLRRTIASRIASISLHKIAAWSRLLSSMSARSSSESVGG